jgi:hypothetical protein
MFSEDEPELSVDFWFSSSAITCAPFEQWVGFDNNSDDAGLSAVARVEFIPAVPGAL